MNFRIRTTLAACLAALCAVAMADPASTPGATPAAVPAPAAVVAPGDRDRDKVIHGRDRNVADRLGTRDQSAAALASGAAAESAAACDSACLQGLVDTYLRAVVAHDPKLLPLADPARFTEMGQELALGDGFWNTASGVGGLQLYALDPVMQQAGFIGTLREFDNVVLMALRLRVQNRRISEIETLFYRKGTGPAWSDAGLGEANARGVADVAGFAPLPAAQRAPREQLINVANTWLSALEHNDGHTDSKDWPVAGDCERFINGARVTGNPKVQIGGPGFNLAALDCRQQLRSGWYAINTRVHHRRVVAVDPDRGLVFVWANIDQAGQKSLQLANGKVLATPALQQPTGTAAVFALRIEGGLVKRVLELDARTPYHMDPGWNE